MPVELEVALKLVFDPAQIELLPVMIGVDGNAFTVNTDVADDEQEFPSVRITV